MPTWAPPAISCRRIRASAAATELTDLQNPGRWQSPFEAREAREARDARPVL